MEHTVTINQPDPKTSGNPQTDAVDQLGGELVVGSGFEGEQPEISLDERN
jgi:hypothetical protein